MHVTLAHSLVVVLVSIMTHQLMDSTTIVFTIFTATVSNESTEVQVLTLSTSTYNQANLQTTNQVVYVQCRCTLPVNH